MKWLWRAAIGAVRGAVRAGRGAARAGSAAVRARIESRGREASAEVRCLLEAALPLSLRVVRRAWRRRPKARC
jgi:hypothetical protein